jgi:hypothetical protein
MCSGTAGQRVNHQGTTVVFARRQVPQSLRNDAPYVVMMRLWQCP